MLFLQQEAAALGLAAERIFGKATEHSGQKKDVEKTLQRAAVARVECRLEQVYASC